MNSTTISVFKALLLHGLVVAVLVYSWAAPEVAPVKPKFKAMKASLVALPIPAVTTSVPNNDRVKKGQEKSEARKKQEQQKSQEKKRQKNLKKEKARLKKEKEKEKKQKEKNRKDKQAKQKREKLRKIQEEQERKATQKAELKKMRAKEAQRAVELEQLRSLESRRLENLEESEEQKEIQQYIAAIQQQLQRNWSRPPSARIGMRSVLKISTIPGGEVISVSVIESSGNAAFDRSAEQAVYRAGILAVPENVALFGKHFREMELIFRPEDL